MKKRQQKKLNALFGWRQMKRDAKLIVKRFKRIEIISYTL